jgi:hypothetical protein
VKSDGAATTKGDASAAASALCSSSSTAAARSASVRSVAPPLALTRRSGAESATQRSHGMAVMYADSATVSCNETSDSTERNTT